MSKSNLENYLSVVVGDADLHARWLNTFSFLEYVGFRKIVKSQAAEPMSAETLSHAVEEGRHALLLKRLALKVGGPKFDSYHPEALLCGAQAEAYFQKLDQHCESSLGDFPAELRARMTYLYVTWLVEIRALEVYGAYQRALGARGLPSALQGLLKEEEHHLQSVERELNGCDPEFGARVDAFKQAEEQLYQNYLEALKHVLGA